MNSKLASINKKMVSLNNLSQFIAQDVHSAERESANTKPEAAMSMSVSQQHLLKY